MALYGGLFNVFMVSYKGDESAFFPTGAFKIDIICSPKTYDNVDAYSLSSIIHIGFELKILGNTVCDAVFMCNSPVYPMFNV